MRRTCASTSSCAVYKVVVLMHFQQLLGHIPASKVKLVGYIKRYINIIVLEIQVEGMLQIIYHKLWQWHLYLPSVKSEHTSVHNTASVVMR